MHDTHTHVHIPMYTTCAHACETPTHMCVRMIHMSPHPCAHICPFAHTPTTNTMHSHGHNTHAHIHAHTYTPTHVKTHSAHRLVLSSSSESMKLLDSSSLLSRVEALSGGKPRSRRRSPLGCPLVRVAVETEGK